MTYTEKELGPRGLAPEVIEMRRWRRHTARLTQTELAQVLGLSRGYLERIERGEVPMPERWPALCAHLRSVWTESMRPPRTKPDGRGRARKVAVP